MLDLAWIVSVAAGTMCLGAGILAWMNAPKSLPAGLFLGAMVAVLFAMVTSPLYPMVHQDHADVARVIAKIFITSVLLAMGQLWLLTLVFPIVRAISFRPLNLLGVVSIVTLVSTILVGLTTEIEYQDFDTVLIDDGTSRKIVATTTILNVLTTAFALYSMSKTDAQGKKSVMIFLAGYWIFLVCGAAWVMQVERIGPFASLDVDLVAALMIAGVAVGGFMFATAIAAGSMTIKPPAAEKLVSSSKTKYRLLHRYVYLVEEPKPDFSFKMFSDILKGRCHDCENDESFPCESLDCSACGLPCPCRKCQKYRSRPQGLIVTRQFPKDVRAKYYLQTTPIVWLSTVAGADNMDPAKLSLLTDNLVNFMEKSQNGVIMVDGLEYLITSNDFNRVLKAIDRWTETAMVSNSRLIISVDSRSFDPKELATLERNREVVRPDATEAWKVIPERM